MVTIKKCDICGEAIVDNEINTGGLTFSDTNKLMVGGTSLSSEIDMCESCSDKYFKCQDDMRKYLIDCNADIEKFRLDRIKKLEPVLNKLAMLKEIEK